MRKIWIWSLTAVFCLVLFLSADAAVKYVFERQWGGSGSGDGQFSSPLDLAINSSGNIFVADTGNNRIQKFINNGTFLSKKGEYPQLSRPTCIAFASGNLYILDYRIESVPAPGGITAGYPHARIQKFGPDPTGSGPFGSLIAQGEIREFEEGERATLQPEGLAVDYSGNIYISDSGNKCIKKYRLGPTGITFIKKWGDFSYPKGIAVDSSGNVYVADTWNHRIQRFNSEGIPNGGWGRQGDGNGEFNSPTDLAVDSNKNVYVIDSGNHRVQVFSYYPTEPVYKFKFSTKFGSEGAGEGQFSDPESIAVDASHKVYVLDGVRIQKFNPVLYLERELRPQVPLRGVPIGR